MNINIEANKNNLLGIYQKVYFNHHNIKNSSSRDRIKKLKKLKKNILLYSDEIKKALFKDFKKHPSEVDITEIYPVTSEINHNIKNISKWMKDEMVKTPITLIGSKSYIKYEPKGTVLIITPWNFPINLTFVSLVNAISAGNSVIIKPSEITNYTSIVIKKIIDKTFNDNEVATVLGGPNTAKLLLELKFNHILFIGSPTIGKIVMESASKFLSSITLELGGKSPTIIDEKCNLKNAAKRVAWAKFLNNGQVCIAPDYLLINSKIKDKFLNMLAQNIDNLYTNKSHASESYCRIVNKKHFNRLKKLLDDATEKGGKIYYGGKTEDRDNYIEPTIIENINDKSKIHKEEVFGPILPIYTYESIENAISFINKKEKPLALYIFSSNKNNIKKILNNTSSGGVCINHSTLHYSNYHLPFGGINNSGSGRCHGVYGFKEFSNKKSVFNQLVSKSPTDLLVPPYNDFKRKIIDILIKYF